MTATMIGKKVLFLNHKPAQCGVHEFGRNLGLALERSDDCFLYRECGSSKELGDIIRSERPAVIIYNYHPATMDWVNVSVTGKIERPQLGIIHEVTQEVADSADTSLFN